MQCWELGNGFAYPYACLDLAKIHDEAGYEVVLAMRDLSHAERLFGDRYPAFQAPTPVFPVPDTLQYPMTAAERRNGPTGTASASSPIWNSSRICR